MRAFFNDDTTFTLQFAAISRLDGQSKRATLQTELESLLPCFLFAATEDRLHRKHANTIPTAFDAKVAAMRVHNFFQRKVLGRLIDPGLRHVAQRLQILFDDDSMPDVNVETFKACFRDHLNEL